MRRGGHPDDRADRRKRVLRRDDHQCRKCGGSRESLHVHHFRPISQGGSHDISNLEALCRSCHAKEHPTKVKLSSAVSDRRRVRMNYRSSSVTRVREPDPYAIETHDGIQYLVGHDYYRNEIRVCRPKRIVWLDVLETSFAIPTSFDATEYLARRLRPRRRSRRRRESAIGRFLRSIFGR